MKLSRLITSSALALALAGAPIVAQATPANVEQARAGTEVGGEELRGGGLLLPLAFLLAAILAVILLTDDGGAPESP
jgi:hypothetical protein